MTANIDMIDDVRKGIDALKAVDGFIGLQVGAGSTVNPAYLSALLEIIVDHFEAAISDEPDEAPNGLEKALARLEQTRQANEKWAAARRAT